MSIKSLVENPHYIYKKYKNYWDFLLRSYEGGLDYIQADVPMASDSEAGVIVKYNGKSIDGKTDPYNLFKHKKERAEDYQERLRMSYYYNFCAPVVDIYTNHLFQHPVVVDYGNIESLVEKRIENVDRQKSSIDEFRRELCEVISIFGHAFVLTDMPKRGNEKSLADRIYNDQFPYFKIYYPQSLVNWSVDQFGNAHWMLFRETTDGNEDWTTFDKQATEVVKYVLWTRMDWTVFDSDFTPIDTGVHGLKRVPVDAIFDKKSKKYRNLLGVSAISDISFIARDVYNKCSELNEILRNQTFAFLTVQGKASDFNELSIGTSKAMLYPEGMNQPAYISPPADNARVIMDQIDKQITKIFQLAKLTGTSGQETGTLEQSGVSKAYDFHETNSALSQKAAHMEDGELRMWQTWATWEGKEFDGNVQYSRDFNVKDLMSDLTEAEKLMRLQMGQMFDAEVKKGIIKKKFPRMPEAEVEQMSEEAAQTAIQANSFGTRIRERLPNFFNQNAIPGGNNGGN